ncbi:MAG TPA: AraC family transcriptional regulator [Clostridiaceae bacterium]|nr:AraC family transcriptional regulator [Clostridiaceae bacterium]
MKVKEIMEKLDLRLAAGSSGLEGEIKDVYISDLLSWVMAHAQKHSAWITIQTHPNVIAVASLLELSCVIIPENADINEETLKKADEESIPVLVSDANGYNICCKLYDLMKDK